VAPSPLISGKPEMALNRRGFLKLAVGLSAVTVPPLIFPKSLEARQMASLKPQKDLWLNFYNRHTGESLKKCIFWAEGIYNPDGLKEINKLFRDHRTHKVHEIHRPLLHVLHKIQNQLETIEPFHLISGYRSPKTNAVLKAHGRGVAKNSQHIYGKAADIYVPGRSLKQVQKAAQSLRAGGVGRYTDFVHVDTGRVRYWGKA
jgi:uncharacterized protein YcbK (DUF882 family)